MNRISVLQYLIDKNNYSKYLEIGTFKGDTFLAIRCHNKIAVDPFFQIPKKKKIQWLYKNMYNFKNIYFEMTSDKFFEKKKDYLDEKGKRDIIFIDGLHTFEASLRDILNSLRYLKNGGTIVMHDCFPPDKAAATPANSYKEASQSGKLGPKGEWCGDVWKTIVYLTKKYPELLKVLILDTDYGLGVIQKQNEKQIDLSIDLELFEKINKMEYVNFYEIAEDKVNLVRSNYLISIGLDKFI
jgi:hypothetical protein